MTRSEIETEKRNAEQLAGAVGGVLAALLGLRQTERPVKFDAQRARFVIDGRFVSIETVRRELRRFEQSVAIRMRKLADRLSDGSIKLDEWLAEMKRLIGSSHVVMAAMASGSITAAAENKKVAERIESERKYAEGFAADITRKDLAGATIGSRAVSYLLAAAITFAIVEQAIRSRSGYTEARRITTAAESCEDCRRIAYEWLPLDEMPEIGSLLCKSRCRCFLEYR